MVSGSHPSGLTPGSTLRIPSSARRTVWDAEDQTQVSYMQAKLSPHCPVVHSALAIPFWKSVLNDEAAGASRAEAPPG